MNNLTTRAPLEQRQKGLKISKKYPYRMNIYLGIISKKYPYGMNIYLDI